MADFCKQCSEDSFGEDLRDLAGLLDDMEDGPDGYVAEVICEGCGTICVDNSGMCMSHCLVTHAVKSRTEIYMERTHDEFIAGLKEADKLALSSGGVLAGPTKEI